MQNWTVWEAGKILQTPMIGWPGGITSTSTMSKREATHVEGLSPFGALGALSVPPYLGPLICPFIELLQDLEASFRRAQPSELSCEAWCCGEA